MELSLGKGIGGINSYAIRACWQWKKLMALEVQISSQTFQARQCASAPCSFFQITCRQSKHAATARWQVDLWISHGKFDRRFRYGALSRAFPCLMRAKTEERVDHVVDPFACS